jgi:cell division protein FtsN
VRIGPFRDPQKLDQVRKRLVANNVNFVVLRLKVDELSSSKD